jgi:ribonuclease P protein component
MVIVPPETKGYAVVIPKKVARLSVTRHLMKRRVMEALRTIPLPKGLILFPKSSAAHLDFAHTQEELSRLLSKIQE